MSHAKSLSVSELFARYLEKQIDAHSHGQGYAESDERATPFEAVTVQPIDPRLAWADALAAALVPVDCDAPPDWPYLVQQQEPAVAVAFCLGNYPQLIRSLHPLLTGEAIAFRQTESRPFELPGLENWAVGVTDEPRRFLAAGVARLARNYPLAERLLATPPSAAWQALHANEVAALAWHRGETGMALQLWSAQPDSVPVLFNRGMAALFLGDSQRARLALDAAEAQLPETSAWHHLAGLYRTIALAQ